MSEQGLIYVNPVYDQLNEIIQDCMDENTLKSTMIAGVIRGIKNALDIQPTIDPETLPIVQELRAELAKEHEQLMHAKNCVAGLSMLLKAVDGKMVMDMVRPIAEKRLNQYRDRHPSTNVVMDEEC